MRQHKEPQCEMEHIDMYHAAGMEWPPPADELNKLFKGALGEMPARSKGLVYLCHKLFSGDDDLLPGIPQLMDANTSIGRLRPDSSSPWFRDEMPTIVGSMKPVVRVRSPSGQDTIRCVSGVECMQMQGWDSTWFKHPEDAFQHYKSELLVNMAGNAFSAFACGPAFAASIPLIGHCADDVDDKEDSGSDIAVGEAACHSEEDFPCD